MFLHHFFILSSVTFGLSDNRHKIRVTWPFLAPSSPACLLTLLQHFDRDQYLSSSSSRRVRVAADLSGAVWYCIKPGRLWRGMLGGGVARGPRMTRQHRYLITVLTPRFSRCAAELWIRLCLQPSTPVGLAGENMEEQRGFGCCTAHLYLATLNT